MKLIVGLGNPGREYADSIHNLGFKCVGHFARKHNIKFDKKKGKARIGTGKVGETDVVVARPQTYMNRSGESVSRLVKYFNISTDNLLVIYDDMDLPLGKIRIREGGSSAGHKGMNSIIQELGRQDFPRLRVGIGHPETTTADGKAIGEDVISYLLSNLPSEEKKVIDNLLPLVSEAILCVITEGITAAMNKYNRNQTDEIEGDRESDEPAP